MCDNSFIQKSSLKQHIESIHKGNKPFKYEICDAYFDKKI